MTLCESNVIPPSLFRSSFICHDIQLNFTFVPVQYTDWANLRSCPCVLCIDNKHWVWLRFWLREEAHYFLIWECCSRGVVSSDVQETTSIIIFWFVTKCLGELKHKGEINNETFLMPHNSTGREETLARGLWSWRKTYKIFLRIQLLSKNKSVDTASRSVLDSHRTCSRCSCLITSGNFYLIWQTWSEVILYT